IFVVLDVTNGDTETPSNTPGILGRRALPAGRLAGLGASPYAFQAAFAVASLLAFLAIVTLIVKTIVEHRLGSDLQEALPEPVACQLP
ncbi:MAG: hypothetical protein ACRD15_06835, partial [Vicinamibacterales bacterium]